MNILWRHKDGSIAVTYLTDECADNPQKHAEKLLKKGDIPSDYEPVAFALNHLPEDWPVEVWDVDKGKIKLHVERAREWHKNRLRKDRAPHLSALDVHSLRNQETGADNASTLRLKQTLRDVTKRVDEADDWESMSAITVPQEVPA